MPSDGSIPWHRHERIAVRILAVRWQYRPHMAHHLALVTLLSSPTLDSGAVWTPVNMANGALAVVGGDSRSPFLNTGTAQFFRLRRWELFG